MPTKKIIHTENAPAAIGAYSQAVQIGDTLYISGQIPSHPHQKDTMVDSPFDAAAHRAFQNLAAIAEAAGFNLDDAVKVNISLIKLAHFDAVNEIMAEYFNEPFPARAVLVVSELPRRALIEIEAVLVLGN